MDFNKVVSFMVGTIVVVLVLVWVGIRLRKRFSLPTTKKSSLISPTPTSLSAGPIPTKTQSTNEGGVLSFLWKRESPIQTPTPAPTIPSITNLRMKRTYVTPTKTQTIPVSGDQSQVGVLESHSYQTTTTPTQIPNTGVSSWFLVFMIAFLGAGIYLSQVKILKN